MSGKALIRSSSVLGLEPGRYMISRWYDSDEESSSARAFPYAFRALLYVSVAPLGRLSSHVH